MPRPLALLSLTSFVASLTACNPPPKEAHDGPLAPSSSSSTSPPSSSAPASSSAPSSWSACASDDDCRLFSSYCEEAPCACRAVLARDPSPRCLGDAASKVRCFADPCLNKATHCQSGICVVTTK